MRVSTGRIIGNIFVPAGVEVCTNMYATARDPSVYADAENFVPERWLTATPQMRNMSRPFSLGPAACVGKSLAEMNLSLLIARLYLLFDITVDGSMTDDMMSTKDKGILHPRDEKLVVRVSRG
jgi:cytochrome P450